jgi:hypothetical protein
MDVTFGTSNWGFISLEAPSASFPVFYNIFQTSPRTTSYVYIDTTDPATVNGILGSGNFYNWWMDGGKIFVNAQGLGSVSLSLGFSLITWESVGASPANFFPTVSFFFSVHFSVVHFFPLWFADLEFPTTVRFLGTFSVVHFFPVTFSALQEVL